MLLFITNGNNFFAQYIILLYLHHITKSPCNIITYCTTMSKKNILNLHFKIFKILNKIFDIININKY